MAVTQRFYSFDSSIKQKISEWSTSRKSDARGPDLLEQPTLPSTSPQGYRSGDDAFTSLGKRHRDSPFRLFGSRSVCRERIEDLAVKAAWTLQRDHRSGRIPVVQSTPSQRSYVDECLTVVHMSSPMTMGLGCRRI